MRYIGWRWACAAPWLLLAGLSAFSALSGNQGWDAPTYLLFLVLPAFLGLATLLAPAGGWLIVVGLAAGIAGGFGVILGLRLLSTGGSALFLLAFVPIVAAIGTIITGVRERDRGRRSRAGA
jgi:peptidoglycan/LPS O-acetylase OafA/YrhL